ncbi:hypothetical protein FACS1894214_1330 [Planctomycetales bacterium]|nr:hypothetical protein FACS1894214_1330 [Planctomycetales bacterium]
MLQFTEYQILPKGITIAGIEEIESALGENTSQWRSILMTELKSYIEELRTVSIGSYLILDGSFVMPCVKNPNDIDIILIMPDDWDTSEADISNEMHLLDAFQIRLRYAHLDVKIVSDHSFELDFWLRCFGNISRDNHFFTDRNGMLMEIPAGVQKGLIQVNL